MIILFSCYVNRAQPNNIFRGKVLYLNSGKKPAVGVEINGSIKEEHSNSVYTNNDGSFELKFPNARVGYLVELSVGDTDVNGQNIELVNDREVSNCRIGTKNTKDFEIIVCKKGERDLVVQKYYHIIKTSSDVALAQKEKEFQALLTAKQKDHNKISKLSAEIAQLQQQMDSLTIYKEAFRIASINKDNATKRVLHYLKLLSEGKSIQEARKVFRSKEL